MKTILGAGVALLLAALPVLSAMAPPGGKWILKTINVTGESGVMILEVDSSGPKPTAKMLSAPKQFRMSLAKPGDPNPAREEMPQPTLEDFKIEGNKVSFVVRQGQVANPFQGELAGSGKVITGTYGPDLRPMRALLTPIDKDNLAPNEWRASKAPEPFSKALAMQNKGMLLTFQAQREKDAEKKAELLKTAAAAQKEADAGVGTLLRETIKNHKESNQSFDAALTLLRGGARNGVDLAEAKELIAHLEEKATAFGPKFLASTRMQVAEMLANDKKLAGACLACCEKLLADLGANSPLETQVKVHQYYQSALSAAGETAKAKEVEKKLASFESKLDEDYAKTVPPFKPLAYSGRKNAKANQVAVMELFTGSQCPPCVAADVAFDALEKAYPAKDLVLLQYHLHIPGPDPMTNPDSIARMNWYQKVHPGKVRSSTPTTLFNGSPQAGGGGAMANAERKFNQYKEIIDPILEKEVPIQLQGTVNRSGDKVTAKVGVEGVGDDSTLKVRFVLVEEVVKYVGGNRLRFHHHVVRAVRESSTAPAKGASKHEVAIDLKDLKKEWGAYLDSYAQTRPFANPARPLDLKELKLIALVQDEKSGEIVQAAQWDVGADKN